MCKKHLLVIYCNRHKEFKLNFKVNIESNNIKKL